ncbi:MAG: hypothetical protein U9N40_09685 [Euryarchaeota archaeon]|nr:hypothetical protein [Euryarchaeota archaeon]
MSFILKYLSLDLCRIVGACPSSADLTGQERLDRLCKSYIIKGAIPDYNKKENARYFY